MRKLLVPVLMALMTLGVSAQTVQIETTDGQMAGGSLVGLFQEGLRYESQGAQMDVAWSAIMSLRSDGEVVMGFGEDERVKVRLIGVQDGRLIVESPLLGSMRLETSGLPSAPAPAPAPEAQAGPLEVRDWSGHVTFNMGLSQGNSDTLLAALEVLLETQSSHDRYEIRLNAVYGESEGTENANAQRLRGSWEHYYHQHLYSFLRAEVFRDQIQEIDFGAFLDVGVGWVVWRESDDKSLALEGGIGYRNETYSDDTDPRNDITGRAALVYESIYFDAVDFGFTAEMIVPLNEPNAWIGRAEMTWSIPVSEHWSFDNNVRVSYRNEPAADADEFDLFVGSGLKYSF